MSEPMNNECYKGKGESDFLDNLVTDNDVYHEANVKRNDFFHRIATNLLSEVLLEVINMTDSVSLRSLASEVPIEVSRIVASDLIIAHCLHLDAEEVAHNSDLGVNHISAACREKPELAYRVFEIVYRVTPKVRPLHTLNRIRKLKLYHLIKVLEAIHEVVVYGASEFLSKSEMILGVRFDKNSGIRKQRGAFYTPIEITKFICENTIGSFLDEKIDYLMQVLGYRTSVSSNIMSELQKIFEIRVIDPACGSGAFLTSALIVINLRRAKMLEICESFRKAYSLCEEEKKQLDEWISILRSENGFLKYFENRMYGVDLDPAALEITSISLSLLSGRDPESEGTKFLYGINLKEGNSLISELPPKEINLHPDELRTLLDLRQQLKVRKGIREKNDMIDEYENIVAQIQSRQVIASKVKCGSQFFKDIKEKKAFCWELEFPEAFYSKDNHSTAGFEFLVMNPPYDVLKPNRLEFKKSYNVREPFEMEQFQQFKKSLKEEVTFYRKSGHYNLAITNVLNLYKLMLERALIITSCTAIMGFIVPSTLLCDQSTANLRREILNKYKVKGIFDFSESAKIFSGVTQAVCIVILDKSEEGNAIPLATELTHIDDLKLVKPLFIPLSYVKKVSGDLRIPKITEFGWKILDKIHSNPSFSEISWISNLRGEVDLTMYKDCLSMYNTGNVLVRGNDISRYVLRRNLGIKESFIFKEKFIKKLGNSMKAKHIGEDRIVGQQISNMTQRWRLKFCLVKSGTFLGNSCNYILISKEKENRELLLLYLLALLNSCLLNWRFKLTNTNNHVSNRELDSLPVKIIDSPSLWENQFFSFIVDKVRGVLQTGTTKVVPEVEAAVFSLYGLTTDEVEFILRSEGSDEYEVRNILEHFHDLNELRENSYKMRALK
jgi:Alw26I/Eco31I/Esp3I family type II restriction m6 adenine DNA methyltransferase